MRNLSFIILIFASGCWGGGGYSQGGSDPLRSFEVDSGCTLASTVALSGSSTQWTGCRLRYDDRAQVYSWQFTTPSTSGTWIGQAPGWFTLAFNLNSAQNARLVLSPIAGTEPGYVPLDQVVFSYAPTTNANVGGDGFVDVAANIIYPGGDQSALEAHLSINIPGVGALTGAALAHIGGGADVADLSAPVDAAVVRDASEVD